METVYNLDQIKEYWEEYQTKKAWRVLRGGVWKIHLKSPNITDGTTKAEMINIKSKVSFPKFLEMFHG